MKQPATTWLKKILVCSFVWFSMPTPVQAQYDSSLVIVDADPRLELLAKKQAQINKVSVYKNSSGQWKGYRVMVLNTNNRDLANQTRAEILRYFPGKGVYMAYQAPYFKLKAGDFLKREDAEKFRKDLARYIKQSLFVVNDIILLTPEDEAKILAEKEEQNL